MEKIAIIGAGIMGADVAFDLASNGHKVILKDIQPDIIEKAKQKIRQDYRMIKMMKPSLKVT